MLHAVDTARPSAGRPEWVSLLAATDLALLERAFESLQIPAFTWLRRPETGLMMVRGRIGGTGDRFNLGEVTVTRCTLRLASGETGVSYVQGRSHRRAELAALADALLQSPAFAPRVNVELIEPARAKRARDEEQRRRKAQATRVDFLTLAREAGA